MITKKLKYTGSTGKEFILHGDGKAWADLNVFRSYSWTFKTASRPSGAGGIVSAFTRPPQTKTLKLTATAHSPAELNAWMNGLQAVTEPDVEANTPGYICIGEQYVRAYITGVNVSEYIRAAGLAALELTVLVTEPYWCTEVTRTFYKAEDQEIGDDYKTFPLRFPYKYASAIQQTTIANTHYSAVPLKLTFYGPCSAPSVVIGGNTYKVSTGVPDGSRLEIDQPARTITLIAQDGTRTNAFSGRDKTHDIFAELPAGESTVSWGGAFMFDVTMIKRRTGLEWT